MPLVELAGTGIPVVNADHAAVANISAGPVLRVPHGAGAAEVWPGRHTGASNVDSPPHRCPGVAPRGIGERFR